MIAYLSSLLVKWLTLGVLFLVLSAIDKKESPILGSLVEISSFGLPFKDNRLKSSHEVQLALIKESVKEDN